MGSLSRDALAEVLSPDSSETHDGGEEEPAEKKDEEDTKPAAGQA